MAACLALSLAATTPAAAAGGFATEELWIENGSRRIYGIEATPDGAQGRLPVDLIAHGFGGTPAFARMAATIGRGPACVPQKEERNS